MDTKQGKWKEVISNKNRFLDTVSKNRKTIITIWNLLSVIANVIKKMIRDVDGMIT